MLRSASASDTRRHRRLWDVAIVLLGSTLIAISSLITVPMVPVPMTMQSWAVLLLAASLGPRLGMAAVMVYLLEGIAGLPVFAGGVAGPARLVGPTGGYLIAFPIAAFVVGWLMLRAERGVLATFAIMLLGHAIIMAAGVGWLAGFVGFQKAVATGFTPFVLGTLVKSALIAATLEACRKLALLGTR